ncbi:hypothetical protein [Pigmentiphaga litoralis]|uniref:hypothetical protein n=1 Tax=Pigmentiphaga litoralis TaxID=516702 RepID=UPI0016739B3D|nr:hypothetical protein [Pigmentiphaga litoralis]
MIHTTLRSFVCDMVDYKRGVHCTQPSFKSSRSVPSTWTLMCHRARLRGVTDAEIPAFIISQLQSSAGSADKITAVMLSQYGPNVSEVATPAQRQGLLSTLTAPQRSQALMSDPRTDLRAIAVQMLNK